MKRFLFSLFLCFLGIGFVSAAVWTDSNGVTWTYSVKFFTNAKGVEIKGASLTKMEGNSNIITVPDYVGENKYPVIAIGDKNYGSSSPFRYDGSITKVVLPSSLIVIGYEAFEYCKGITSIEIPSEVTYIGERGFCSCDLKSITIPQNVETISIQAFANNIHLSSIKMLPIEAPYFGGNNFLPFDHCGTNEIHVYKTATGYDEGIWTEYIIKKDISINLATKISVNSSSEHVSKGESISLEASITPSYATIKDVVWNSSNEKVLKSLGNGKFEAVADGFAYARATTTDGSNLTASCRVSVGSAEFVDVTAVSLDQNDITLHKGESKKLKATITPDNASFKSVTWKSSNTQVATVDIDGVIKAIGKGFAKITATAEDNDKVKDVCNVTVLAPLTTSLKLDETSVEMDIYEKVQLKAIASPSDAEPKVTWTSNNTDVVMVDAYGKLTPISEGEAIVMAKATDGSNKAAAASVTVKHAPYNPYLSAQKTGYSYTSFSGYRINFELKNNGKETIKVKRATAKDPSTMETLASTTDASLLGTLAPGGTIGLSVNASSNISIASEWEYEYKGQTYTYCSWRSYKIITPADKITLNSTSANLVVGQTWQLTSTISPQAASTNNVLWKSSDENVATVTADGRITAVGEGTATITATVIDENKKSASCIVNVRKHHVTGVTLDTTYLDLGLGESKTISAKVSPDDVNTQYASVIWTSSDNSVATVSNGVINAVGEGRAFIAASAKDDSGITATCEITVTKYDITSLALSEENVIVELGGDISLTAEITPSNAYNKQLVWTSSNEDVAMVNTKGKVVGISEGEAVITVASEEHPEITASVVVKVIPLLVKSITLNHTSYTLGKGENIQLVATLLPEEAPNKDVKWTTDNEDVIMVSSNGRCVYMADGKATVTATTCDGSNLSATCVFNCTDGIITITTDSPDLEFFATDGRRINEMQNGVNIIRTEDGKTVKVLKK